MAELHSLATEVNNGFNKLKSELTETTPLPYLWWYVVAENPYLFYDFAGVQIKVMTYHDGVVILEKEKHRGGVYQVLKPPAEQLDKPTREACTLYLSSLVLALRQFWE